MKEEEERKWIIDNWEIIYRICILIEILMVMGMPIEISGRGLRS